MNYLKISNEPLLQGVKHTRILEFKATVDKKVFKKNVMEGRKETWLGKQMYGQFVRDMNEMTDKEGTLRWLSKSDLKSTTEALICAAQEQAIRTNYTKYAIDKTTDSPACRMCEERGETISHIASECKKLAQKEYKRRHDNVAKMVQWKLCEKFGLERADKWYKNRP